MQIGMKKTIEGDQTANNGMLLYEPINLNSYKATDQLIVQIVKYFFIFS
jgi:hypothetical protein